MNTNYGVDSSKEIVLLLCFTKGSLKICVNMLHFFKGLPNDLFNLNDYMPTFLDAFMPHCIRQVLVSNWCITASRIFCPAATAKVNNLKGVIV